MKLCVTGNVWYQKDSILYAAVFNVLLLREDFPDGAFYGKSIHEAPELLSRKFSCFVGGTRPLKAIAGKKPFRQQEHSIAFKQEAFNTIRPVPAEEEQSSLFCSVQAIVQFDICSESGYPLSEVNPAAAYDNAGKADSFLKHG